MKAVCIQIGHETHKRFAAYARSKGFRIGRAIEIILDRACNSDELQKDIAAFIATPSANPRHHDLQAELTKLDIKELTAPVVTAPPAPTAADIDIDKIIEGA